MPRNHVPCQRNILGKSGAVLLPDTINLMTINDLAAKLYNIVEKSVVMQIDFALSQSGIKKFTSQSPNQAVNAVTKSWPNI